MQNFNVKDIVRVEVNVMFAELCGIFPFEIFDYQFTPRLEFKNKGQYTGKKIYSHGRDNWKIIPQYKNKIGATFHWKKKSKIKNIPDKNDYNRKYLLDAIKNSP